MSPESSSISSSALSNGTVAGAGAAAGAVGGVVVNGVGPLVVSQPAGHLIHTHTLTHKVHTFTHTNVYGHTRSRTSNPLHTYTSMSTRYIPYTPDTYNSHTHIHNLFITYVTCLNNLNITCIIYRYNNVIYLG